MRKSVRVWFLLQPEGTPGVTAVCCDGGAARWLRPDERTIALALRRALRGEGDAPDETLIKDGPILVTGLLYGLTVVGILIAHNFELLPDIFAAPLPGRLPVPGVGG